MHKKIIENVNTLPDGGPWLDIEKLATVEITSEDEHYPLEAALLPGAHAEVGWRAAAAGKQTIRLVFHSPQVIRRIQLRFRETTHDRTQEFVLQALEEGQGLREFLRQQWTFSPGGATEEFEDYHVQPMEIRMLELVIIPDISGRPIQASLHRMRVQ